MDASRLADIESTVAFQEKAIEDLSGVICRQQRDIDALQAQYERVMARLDQADDDTSAPNLEIVPPPNY